MSAKWYCDHCRKEIVCEKSSDIMAFVQVARSDKGSTFYGAAAVDLCNKCFGELRSYVRNFIGQT